MLHVQFTISDQLRKSHGIVCDRMYNNMTVTLREYFESFNHVDGDEVGEERTAYRQHVD